MAAAVATQQPPRPQSSPDADMSFLMAEAAAQWQETPASRLPEVHVVTLATHAPPAGDVTAAGAGAVAPLAEDTDDDAAMFEQVGPTSPLQYNALPPLTGFAYTAADDVDKSFVFGGLTEASGYARTLYELDLRAGTCSKVAAAGTAPHPCGYSSLGYADGCLIHFGGVRNGFDFRNEVRAVFAGCRMPRACANVNDRGVMAAHGAHIFAHRSPQRPCIALCAALAHVLIARALWPR